MSLVSLDSLFHLEVIAIFVPAGTVATRVLVRIADFESFAHLNFSF